jgi:hypothetical protein
MWLLHDIVFVGGALKRLSINWGLFWGIIIKRCNIKTFGFQKKA